MYDPAYNAQMGTAELSDAAIEFRGDQISPSPVQCRPHRVKEWIEPYGDPRDPKVDPVDWIERIPFSETRNYVQRVIENMQLYRARFEGSGTATAKSEQRVTTHEVSAAPTAAAAAAAPSFATPGLDAARSWMQ